MYQYRVICGMYVAQQYDTAFGCCCSCHTSTCTAPVVLFYMWYEYAYLGTIKTYQVCESAAVWHCVPWYILCCYNCCCCCYCSSLYTCHPRCFSYSSSTYHQPLVLVVRTNVLYCWNTPLGGTVAFVRPRLYRYLLLRSIFLSSLFANTGMREATGGRQPAAAKPPLYSV